MKKFEIKPDKKFEVKHQFKIYPDAALLSEVEPISEGMVDPIKDNRSLETLVEYPLLESVQAFVEKGIKTWSSSANRKDVGGEAYIILYYDSLNENNKEIAKKYKISEQQGYALEKLVKISIKTNEQTTVGDIKHKFHEIVDHFEKQN